MIKLEQYPIFSSSLYRGKIDSNIYEKVKIVNAITENYYIDPCRNNWDADTHNMHMYYNDWDNVKFNKIDPSTLLPIYSQLFDQFLHSLNPLELIDFNFKIANFTVTNKVNSVMPTHSHSSEKNCIFTAVHYLKASHSSSVLLLENPLIYKHYMDDSIENYMRSKFGGQNINYSPYSNYWYIRPVEDEIVIFPSYLKHSVQPIVSEITSSNTNSEFRIAAVINLYLN
jgi:hypothetical protein